MLPFISLLSKFGMSGVGPLMSKHWKLTTILVLVLVNVAQWEWYWPAKVEWWRTKHDGVNEQLTQCELSRTELKTEIGSINNQVDEWLAVSVKQEEQFAQLNSRLNDLVQRTDDEVNAILNTKVPKGCDGSVKHLKQSIDNLNW